MKFTKNLKKIFICGTSLLLITSLGTGITSVSAHRVHRYHYRYARVIHNNQRNYKSIIRYLHWVRRYDMHHKRHFTSRKLCHINRYLKGFNYNQKRYVYNIIKKVTNNHHVKRSYKYISKRNEQARKRLNKTYRHHKLAPNAIANVADLEKPDGKNVQSAKTEKHTSPTNGYQPTAINTNVPVVTPAVPVIHNNNVNNRPNYQPHPTPVIHHQVTPVINNSGNNTDENLNQMKNQSLIDVNNDRQTNGLPILKENSNLDNLANLRAKQITVNYSHNFFPKTFQKAGVALNKVILENITQGDMGSDEQYGDPKIYHNNNGIDLANELNDAFMNYDQPENNGHRDNILNSTVNSIGIGASQKNGTYYLTEEMSNY